MEGVRVSFKYNLATTCFDSVFIGSVGWKFWHNALPNTAIYVKA